MKAQFADTIETIIPEVIAWRRHLHQNPEPSFEEFETTDVYQWLLEHSYEYGYVLRYPSDKVTITQKESCNIFRYVGKENAQKMHNQNLCLEELNNQ